MQHYLTVNDLSKKQILEILELAQKLKTELKSEGENKLKPLLGKTVGMLFEKPSLRTRISFEVAVNQLGGQSIFMKNDEFGLNSREPVKDIANVVSSMVDMVVARVYKHDSLKEFAEYSKVSLINALSDLAHPCQALADILTINEVKGLDNIKLCYVGDCDNNVANSLRSITNLLGVEMSFAGPGYKTIDNGVADSDVVYTDTWVSMGDEAAKEKLVKKFSDFQVNEKVMKLAKPDAIFMHDMPAYRGYEVTDDVIDGLQSVIYQQAENRLHAQKALLQFLMTA
ncbi:ornithine carbamoyltransferase [Candidatus Saccharibacteria bacterium]|jgi:ornithine carbamoyltransferase|nr:ornithine carbamoyltransferase [Candidatus Saccharibacteria bacterium]